MEMFNLKLISNMFLFAPFTTIQFKPESQQTWLSYVYFSVWKLIIIYFGSFQDG